MIRVLAIGDVVGKQGCAFVRERLPGLRKRYGLDLVVANGENSAAGNGILPSSAKELFDSGVDVITTGNHVFKRREVFPYLEEAPFVIRPGNYPSGSSGKGSCVYDAGSYRVSVINLQGTVFMESLESPFEAADRILKTVDTPVVLVDFHAEATSEKAALARYLDGRVSAVFGTHTHVPTADETILSGGTGFVTDLGMTGPSDSILGVRQESVISRFLTKMPARFETADGPCRMDCVLFEIEKKAGKCLKIERLFVK